ncbi:hypothetical protein [Phenylobacterium sp.]|uniref:hypothetical protein n=1 Tax=Phenylobacterium sp. TaxID=1871053 RepID=UPI002869F25D|nr:hypothetical protein [Phenylobacterium sp.]
MTEILDPPSMADRHAFGLQRLAELSGKLVEQAYMRAVRADEPEEKDRAGLVFDRLARGYRLTVALEARMARDLRREAREVVERETQARPPRAADGPRPGRASVPCEIDQEDEADLEVSDQSLGIRLKDLSHLLEARADLLDPDGQQRAALAEVAAWWAVGQPQTPCAQTPDNAAASGKTSRRPRSAGTSRDLPVRSPETPPSPSPMAVWRGSG